MHRLLCFVIGLKKARAKTSQAFSHTFSSDSYLLPVLIGLFGCYVCCD